MPIPGFHQFRALADGRARPGAGRQHGHRADRRALGAKPTFFPPGAPWTLYLGGVFGFVIIASLAFVFPKIGAAYAVALMVGGQCLAALVVDHFGWMGMPRDPVTIQRVVGVVLVAAGAAVIRA